jgi:hypothetical protein
MMLSTKLVTILEWITSNWFPNIPAEDRREILRVWISLIEFWITTQGASHTIKRVKFIRLCVTRFKCGEPILANDLMVGLDKTGFPSSIGFMKSYVESCDPEHNRFIYTLLGITRAMSGTGKIDYSSITAPFKGKYRSLPKDFIDLFVADFTHPFEESKLTVAGFFLNLKSGPLSGPAILKAHLATRFYTGRNLWGLNILLGSEGMKWFKDLFLSCKVKLMPQRNRKLHIISDPELKERVIAIFDYISQLAFEPISKYLFDVLRSIPQDRTFTQDPVIKDKREGEHYHSLDLTSATDRFPIDLQVDLLNSIERHSPRPFRGIGNAWKSVMVSEPFLTPEGDLLYYKVGQPMGARSSWAAFTLSHHCVVQYAAFQCAQYPFKEYILLGDDIVIYSDAVAEKYKQIISDLGVDCSPMKSHSSLETYEFAKRWFHKGIEISGVPLKGFLANTGNPVLLFQDLLELVYKGRGPKSVINSVSLGKDLIKRLGYSRSQIRHYSNMFSDIRLTYRITKEYPDLQLWREFSAAATWDNEYIMPSNEAALMSEITRTSSMVVNGMVMSITRNLSKYYTDFKSRFDNFITAPCVEFCKPEVFFEHPLVYALYSSVRRYDEMNRALNYTYDLSSQLMTVTLLDLEKLQLQSRTSVDIMFTFRTFARKLRLQLENDPYQIIAKAQTMRFGRSLLDLKLAWERDNPIIKTGMLRRPD